MEDSLARIYRLHRGRLERLARSRLSVPADAEDVVHEAFARLAALGLGQVDTPVAWLHAVIAHLAVDRGRHEAVVRARTASERVAHDADPMAAVAPSAEALAERREAVAAAIARLVERLSSEEAALVVLREVFDADYADLAVLLARSEAACRQALHRARRRLADETREERRPEVAADAFREHLEHAIASRDERALRAWFATRPTAACTAHAAPVPPRCVLAPADSGDDRLHGLWLGRWLLCVVRLEAHDAPWMQADAAALAEAGR